MKGENECVGDPHRAGDGRGRRIKPVQRWEGMATNRQRAGEVRVDRERQWDSRLDGFEDDAALRTGGADAMSEAAARQAHSQMDAVPYVERCYTRCRGEHSGMEWKIWLGAKKASNGKRKLDF